MDFLTILYFKIFYLRELIILDIMGVQQFVRQNARTIKLSSL